MRPYPRIDALPSEDECASIPRWKRIYPDPIQKLYREGTENYEL